MSDRGRGRRGVDERDMQERQKERLEGKEQTKGILNEPQLSPSTKEIKSQTHTEVNKFIG